MNIKNNKWTELWGSYATNYNEDIGIYSGRGLPLSNVWKPRGFLEGGVGE